MKQRDLELLSSYLDGQLSPSDSARLESRLASDADLRAVMDDLREARNLLRRLPARKAPRNFTLTRKMVGQSPPMPRAYPAFRFVTALATLLLFFTLGLNFLGSQMASQAPVPGMGGGGGQTDTFAAQAPAATEAPAAEAPPAVEMAPMPTATLAEEDSGRIAETPAANNGLAEEPSGREGIRAPLIAPLWQIVLTAIVVMGVVLMLLMRQAAASRWRR